MDLYGVDWVMVGARDYSTNGYQGIEVIVVQLYIHAPGALVYIGA